MKVLVAAVALVLLALMAPAVAECAACSQSEVRQSVEMRVGYRPAAVLVGEKTSLRYELHVTNFSGTPQSLNELEVLDGSGGHVLHRFNREQMMERAGSPLPGASQAAALAIDPWHRVVLYLDIDLDGTPPDTLAHRLKLVAGEEGHRNSHWVEAAVVTIDKAPLPVLGPPLRGGPWIAVHDPMMERGHRRVIYALNGTARIPGRHAIDWMFASPSTDRTAESGLGAEVLAVADALVVAIHDGVPEPENGVDPSRIPLAEAPGNFVALDLGDGRYAVYEHLHPGILVEPGDRVRRGQTIAYVGTTGHATRPHLHFHVGNSANPLAAEGLPFLIESGHVLGRYDSVPAAVSGGPWNDVPGTSRHDAPFFPAANTVLHFP